VAARRILVTSALPYANGPTHLGHMTEVVQCDIWVRAMRLSGHECIYVCADDTHGTPIMLKAEAEGVTPEELIRRVGAERRADFAAFGIGFDNYYTTHSEENRRLTVRMYEALAKAGHITRRTVRQAYDEKAGLFLPDRYVKGTCPRCGTPDQYGDSCENCGATYSPSDLIDAVSVVSGTRPVERESEHIFFRLGDFERMLRAWTRSGSLQPAVANKLDEWFEAGLRDWDVSRDAPYFGFEIPDAPGKYFYVWLDAPVGYMASFANYCTRAGLDFEDWWKPDSPMELHHFIGKDILYFHSLFWPATLEGAGFRKPTAVHAHGFLTVNGEKMSKSRGTFVTARRYLDHLPPEYFRYFLAAKLGPGLDDIDMNFGEFATRINADLVGKLVNIASRCASFIHRGHGGRLAAELPDPALYREFTDAGAGIMEAWETLEYAAAVREIMALADRANLYIDRHKPWLAAKDPARAGEVQGICTQGINLFRALMAYLKPVMPLTAERAEAFLAAPVRHWRDVEKPLLGSAINEYQPLATRLDAASVQNLVETPMPPTEPAAPAAPATAGVAASSPAQITPEDFAKMDLRIARVEAADFVEGADRLLKLSVDLGGERRTVFAGIRGAYEPAALVGRHIVVVANLKPKKMRFGTSEGMALAASDDQGLFLLAPDAGARAGMKVS
jgi:methionyl-tRNA synthetase